MQQVLPFSRMADASPYMDAKVLDYLNEGQIETFESFPDFSVLAFSWYDWSAENSEIPQVLIYLDREDLFFFCEDSAAEEKTASIVDALTEAGDLTNGQLLYRFFSRLLKGDTAHLDALETSITDTENEVLSGKKKGYLESIIAYRRELLHLKRYYEQLDSIFDELAANDNGLLPRETVRRFTILGSRTERLLAAVESLRETVTQMREAYQSQIDIEQNDLMKIFTVVTVIFLPLTLLVGWYGMNFQMPELHWQYGYPVVIAVSVVIVVWLIVYFKKKKWF
ncbi:MAG: magnesium transporter [Oscillibacter sp.]|nr:magnesium transporter [Oscillibacter sp.]